MTEKRWMDYNVPKGEWLDIPLEDIKSKAIENEGEVQIADELFSLINTAYAKIGGHFDFKSAEDLPGSYSDWIAVDLDDDPEPDALRVLNKKGAGQKMVASGHDGTRSAIRAYLAKSAELFHSEGFYGELSKGIAHIMIKHHNVPFVNNQDEVERVLGKTVEWVGEHPEGKYPGYNGWYVRKISGMHEEMKILVGRPIGIRGITQP